MYPNSWFMETEEEKLSPSPCGRSVCYIEVEDGSTRKCKISDDKVGDDKAVFDHTETVENSTTEETSRDRTEEWETQEEKTIPGSVSTTESSMYSDSDTYDTVMDSYERDIQINKLRAKRYRASASMHRARAERNRAIFEEKNVQIEATVLLFSTVLVLLLNVVEKLFSRKNTESF